MQWTLEAMRINKGLTQLELAEKFEVSSQTIARLEKDSSDIGYQLLKKYMDYFNVKFDDIFLGTNYKLKRNFVNQPN
ncbi:TPA: helix-turn-helix transcriptional regulator [Streptococcus suis]|nr:helix-turn-helix transcriptional regulator [Streptococcus suis]